MTSSSWSDHITPILPLKATMAEMSSAATSLSAPAVVTGIGYGAPQVRSSVVEWATSIRSPCSVGDPQPCPAVPGEGDRLAPAAGHLLGEVDAVGVAGVVVREADDAQRTAPRAGAHVELAALPEDVSGAGEALVDHRAGVRPDVVRLEPVDGHPGRDAHQRPPGAVVEPQLALGLVLGRRGAGDRIGLALVGDGDRLRGVDRCCRLDLQRQQSRRATRRRDPRSPRGGGARSAGQPGMRARDPHLRRTAAEPLDQP